jgi:hypothetical protein
MKPKAEYGDFQTPGELARAVCRVVRDLGIRPAALLEPTCGTGSFLKAGLEAFGPGLEAAAFDISADHVRTATASVAGGARVARGDFFEQDWRGVIGGLPEPLLVLGNPPWVTNAALGAMGGGNAPAKSNFQGHSGLDALTGKSNFDVSEYMLIRLSEALEGRDATLAMLAKTAVVRRLLAYCWKRGLRMGGCHIFPIDGRQWFGVSVKACAFVASFRGRDDSCIVHSELRADSSGARIGYRDGVLVSDADAFERWRGLGGEGPHRWRSGIKHDCAKVMEFREQPGGLVNGLGERVEIEGDLLYPLLKSSGLAGSAKAGRRWMLVPQRETGDTLCATPPGWTGGRARYTGAAPASPSSAWGRIPSRRGRSPSPGSTRGCISPSWDRTRRSRWSLTIRATSWHLTAGKRPPRRTPC